MKSQLVKPTPEFMLECAVRVVFYVLWSLIYGTFVAYISSALAVVRKASAAFVGDITKTPAPGLAPHTVMKDTAVCTTCVR